MWVSKLKKTHQITFSLCITFTELYIFPYLVLTKGEKLLVLRLRLGSAALLELVLLLCFYLLYPKRKTLQVFLSAMQIRVSLSKYFYSYKNQ